MKISTKGRYALRMLLDLAEHQSQGFITLKDIAKRQGSLKISRTNRDRFEPSQVSKIQSRFSRRLSIE